MSRHYRAKRVKTGGRWPYSRRIRQIRINRPAWLALMALLGLSSASAQEALRNSLAGQAAAEARRLHPATDDYTLKSGDFKLLATPSLGVDWNDNIKVSKVNPQEDVIFKPMVGLNSRYPVTPYNLFQVDVTVGYEEYVQHDNMRGLYLQSGSELSFDMTVSDFLINYHDRLSYDQDAAGEAAIANTGSDGYKTFQNTAGVNVTWDLRDVTLSLGYDHVNYKSYSQMFEQTDHSSEMVVTRASLSLNPRITAGMEGTVAFTTYEKNVLNNNVNYSIGPYVDWQPGQALHVQPRVGYTFTKFQQSSQSGFLPIDEPVRTSDMSSWYADVTVTHQVTDAISYSLNAGHEIRLGIQSDTIEDSFFRPSINWNIVRNVSLETAFFYEHGKQGEGNVSGNYSETYDQYGGSLNIGYQLMQKLRASLNYRLTVRSSDEASRAYTQNVVGILLSYQLK